MRYIAIKDGKVHGIGSTDADFIGNLTEAEFDADTEVVACPSGYTPTILQDDPRGTTEWRQAEIYDELAVLDTYLPRSIEDLIESGAVSAESLSMYNQGRLAQKQTLRAELVNLT